MAGNDLLFAVVTSDLELQSKYEVIASKQEVTLSLSAV